LQLFSPVKILRQRYVSSWNGHLPSWGTAGQTAVGSSTGDFERWLKGDVEVGVSLCGSSVKVIWGEGSLAGTLEDM